MRRPTGWRALGYVCSSVSLLGVLACSESAPLDPAEPATHVRTPAAALFGQTLDIAAAAIPKRSAGCRIFESEDRGTIVEGEVQFQGADASKDYTAAITIKENANLVANSPLSITLPAGQKEAEEVTNDDEIVITKRHLPRGEIVIVANARAFDVSGRVTDVYELGIQLNEAGTNVVNMLCTGQFG